MVTWIVAMGNSKGIVKNPVLYGQSAAKLNYMIRRFYKKEEFIKLGKTHKPKASIRKYMKLNKIQLHDDERWLEINGELTHYIIKTNGDIISYQRNPDKPVKLKPIILWIYNEYHNRVIVDSNRLYRAVNIMLPNGKEKLFHVHKLVALTFIPNPNNYPEINHKNGNKSDNSVENLEWCSSATNIREAYKLGLIHTKKGSKHHAAKINEDTAFDIGVLLLYSKMSRAEIAKVTNASLPIVDKINKGYRWKHVTEEFGMKYPLMSRRINNLKCSTTRERSTLIKYGVLTE